LPRLFFGRGCIFRFCAGKTSKKEALDMPKGKEPFSLKNMNGISHDDTRSCALSDMNCRRGQPDAPASLQDMNAAKKRPHKKYSLTDMNAQEGR
jgi:hypothetical protein